MFSRLFKALRYLFTGRLEHPAKEPETVDLVQNPYNPSLFIMKDSFNTPKGRATVEVRGDGLHVQVQGSDEQQLIPINGGAGDLNGISEEIRTQITRKISLLLPELATSDKKELLAHVFHVLSLLANDQLPRVRQMIAEELSELYNAPLELVKRLAWDDQLAVSGPILEFSPMLSEQDLLEIIANSALPGVMTAIAKRKTVSGAVSSAIVTAVTSEPITEEGEITIEALLENKGAKLEEKTLNKIIDNAAGHDSWHERLINRPEVTPNTMDKIAKFVTKTMIVQMQERGMISRELGENLSSAVSERIQNPHRDKEKEADAQVAELHQNGRLDAEFLTDALEHGEREIVLAGIALLSQTPKPMIRKILETHDAKAVTALTWRAGLPMRTAIQMQLKLAKIHYTKILYAKNGQDFPLTTADMEGILAKFEQESAEVTANFEQV